MTTTLTIGATVKIHTASKEIDPNNYTVKSIMSPVVLLTCVGTGRTIKVHESRICEILNSNSTNTNSQENTMSTSTETVIDSTTQSTTQPRKEKAPKQPRQPKPKVAPEQVNFQEMVDAGQEVWTKTGLSLGKTNANVQVSAHCIISADGSTYEIFNTYNGSRGHKGTSGKIYQFNEKLTLEKKRAKLAKDGYTQFGSTSTTQEQTESTSEQ